VYDIALETISHGDGASTRKPDAASSRLPDGHAAQAGRAVGDPDHAAPGADREPAPRRARIAPTARAQAWPPWADQMTEIAEQDPKNLILVIADMARSNPPMTTSFVSRARAPPAGQSPAWRCR
jgi:hypothetical protein